VQNVYSLRHLVRRRRRLRNQSTACDVWSAVSQVFKIHVSGYYNCDSTSIRLRFDYDEKWTCSFFRRIERRRSQ